MGTANPGRQTGSQDTLHIFPGYQFHLEVNDLKDLYTVKQIYNYVFLSVYVSIVLLYLSEHKAY